MNDRILLSEWSGSSSQGAALLGHRGERSACPVCGHPTMDCVHDPHTERISIMAGSSKTGAAKAAQNQADETKAVIDSDPTEGGANAEAGLTTAGVGDDAVLVKDGETPSGFYEDSGEETYVTVTKDVVEEFYYPGTKRPAYRVRFTKGQVVPKAVIDQLEADVKAREADPNALENYVDSSTLASGTGANASE